jgi:HTH-type transcriptional regulator/antitoxin MqsA
MKSCPVCGEGKLERKTKRQTFHYEGYTLRYEQPGLWCDACGEGILDHIDMNATGRLLYDFRASVDGYLTTADVRRIRKKLGLTQKQAGEMLAEEDQAFRRYESGSARPPKSIDTLLRLLDRHPELLNEIPKGKAA